MSFAVFCAGGAVGVLVCACLVLLGFGRRAEEMQAIHDEAYAAGRARGYDDARRKFQGMTTLIGRCEKVEHGEGVGS